MKKNIWKSLILIVSLFLVACGQTSQADDGSTIVQVGIGNAYPPFTYLDDAGNPAGYDLEVLKKVDEKLTDYSFEYQPMEFKTILTALDANQVRMAAHQYEKNEERAARYLFADETYTDYSAHVVTPKYSDFNPQSLDDLVGKTVSANNGSNMATVLSDYNAEHDSSNQINIVYGDASNDVKVNDLTSGKTDATLMTTFDVDKLNANYDNVLKKSGEPIYNNDTHFVYKQGDEELKEAVDGVLAELKADGTLEQLQEEFITVE